MPLPERLIQPVAVSRGTLAVPVPDELEGVTNGSLANIIRQLSSLSRHAEEMFGNLFAEAESVAQRSSSLQARIDRLSVKVTQLDSTVEEVSLQDIHLRKAFRSSQAFDQQVVSRETMPKAMLEAYMACDKPPPLDKLNPYREDGRDGLKFYTDPNYFFDLWRQEMLKDTERMMHDRGKKPGKASSSGGGKKQRVRQPGNMSDKQKQKALGQPDYIIDPQTMQPLPSQPAPEEFMQNQQHMYDQMLQQQQQMNPQMPLHMSRQMYSTEQESIYTPRILRNEQQQQQPLPQQQVQPSPLRMQVQSQVPMTTAYQPTTTAGSVIPSMDVQQQQQSLMEPYGSYNPGQNQQGSPTRRPSQPPPAPPPGDLMGLNSPPTLSPTHAAANRDSLPPPPPPPTTNGFGAPLGTMQLPPPISEAADLPPPPPVPTTTTLGVNVNSDHLAPSPPLPPAPEPLPVFTNGSMSNQLDKSIAATQNGVTGSPNTMSSPVKVISSEPAAQSGPPAAPAPPPPPPPPPGGLLLTNGIKNGDFKKQDSNKAGSTSPQKSSSPSKNGNLILPTQPVKKPSIPQHLQSDGVRSDLLKAIRDGIALRKVEQQTAAAAAAKEETKSGAGTTGQTDVASILARRVAVEMSDSDAPSDSEYDSDDWGDESTA